MLHAKHQKAEKANGQIKNVLHVSKPANAPVLSIGAKSRVSLSPKELEVEHSRGREHWKGWRISFRG